MSQFDRLINDVMLYFYLMAVMVGITGLTGFLRTVPTIVTAHMFCASQYTRVSYGWCLLIQEYFCAV